ncbi:MAG: helix-turn-helix domain-containing protein [Oscillospiraceae bacterium]|nr:helix-turn-helix domain-containing protein [Oscillospiraceae bacterium]
MTFAEKLKEMRTDKGVTQVGLAADLGISKGTVAMWETGKREPNFEMLHTLSDYFDRRIDYILGQTEDKSSPKTNEEQLGVWETEEHFCKAMLAYLQLDEYGKNAVESVIRAETRRCKEQETLFPKSNFSLELRTRKGGC